MTATVAPVAPSSSPAPAGRVLIIDDEEPIRIALGRALRRLGFDVIDAHDGESGLAAIVKSDPDVVFLDLRMPGVDGHAFLRRMQAEPLPHPPSVIVMSGQGNMDDVIEVLRQGAVDYLRKPWNLTELMSAVTRGLELRNKATGGDAKPAADATTAAARDPKRSARFAQLLEKLRRGEIVLPAVPSILSSLRKVVDNPASSIDDVATLVERDPRVAADLLRLANAAHYSRLGRTPNVKTAITRLGLRHVHNLVQTIFLQGFCTVRAGPNRELLTAVWRRSVARAVATRALCDLLDPTHALNGDTAYLVGLMADVGASLMLWVVSERSQGNLTADDVCDEALVLDLVRRSHEDLGKALLTSWNFDPVVVTAVSQHHRLSPPTSHTAWWSIAILGNHLATRLLGKEDPTAEGPLDPIVVDRCAAEFCVPPAVLGRLSEQLKGEFDAISASIC